MRYTQHPTNNDVLGAPKGWNQTELPCGALPVTRTTVEGQPVMVSFWRPDAEELAALNRGDAVSLWIYGGGHPVVAIGVSP
nr:hypothetical protein [uncultured Albidiferax sp.]